MSITYYKDRDAGDWLTMAIWTYLHDPTFAEGGSTKQSGAPPADSGNSSEWGLNNQFREIADRLLDLNIRTFKDVNTTTITTTTNDDVETVEYADYTAFSIILTITMTGKEMKMVIIGVHDDTTPTWFEERYYKSGDEIDVDIDISISGSDLVVNVTNNEASTITVESRIREEG